MPNNPIQMIQQFNNFRRTIQGNPKEQVEQLLRSGQMSQEQFNWLQGQATQFQEMLNNFKL